MKLEEFSSLQNRQVHSENICGRPGNIYILPLLMSDSRPSIQSDFRCDRSTTRGVKEHYQYSYLQ